MHAQPRGGIDLDDSTTHLGNRLAERRGHHIDAGNIQTDNFGDAFGHETVGLVDPVGHIFGRSAGGEVGGQFQMEGFAFFEDGFHAVIGFGQQMFGNRRNFQAGHDVFMSKAPIRVPILNVDQFGDGMLTVADHLGRHALGGSHECAAHHQHAIVASREVLFDDDPVAHLLGARKGFFQLFFI